MFTTDDRALVGSNGRVEVRFDADTGGVRRLVNLTTGQVLVDQEAPVPWTAEAQGGAHRLYRTHRPPSLGTPDPEPAGFTFSIDDGGETAMLRWSTNDPGISVEVRAVLESDGDLELWPRVVAAPDAIAPATFTYPVLTSPLALSENASDDRLVYPGHTGFLVHDPLAADPLDGPYPDGYAGLSIQMMAYFTQGKGGFYIATHDPHSTTKRFRFSSKEISVVHDSWDLRTGASIDLDYAVVVAPLTVGDWYEAVDRYREWALHDSPWGKVRRPNWNDPDRAGARWLFDEVGLAIRCTPGVPEWSAWYRHYAEVAGTPLHITPAWDWPAQLPPSIGEEGYFPARFHPDNMEVWKDHRVTPYLNDIFISSRATDFFERWEPNLLLPYVSFPWTIFSGPPTRWVDGDGTLGDPRVTTNADLFICPVTDTQKEFHTWRDLKLATDYDMDGVFYDISSGNPWVWSRCLRAEHGHSPGRGRQIIEAYAENNLLSKAAVARETGRYYTQGVETIVENVVGSVEFYVSRACAGPMGFLETPIFGPEEEAGGNRDLIPLFQAVYHDVGPVHEDGWITLDEREGDLFYWIAGRIYLLWGGIISLQYCTVPPDRIDTDHGPAETIVWDGARHRWTDEELTTPDPGKEAFVRDLALARTEFANEFIAFGKMVRPPVIDAGTVGLDFWQRFYWWEGDTSRNQGTWRVPRVLHAAWRCPDGRIGVVMVNLGTEPVEIPIEGEAGALWDREFSGKRIDRVDSDGRRSLGAVGMDNRFDVMVDLEPRRVTLLDIGG